MLKGKKIPDMILITYFLKHVNIISDLKMNNPLIQQEKNDIEESVHLSDMPPIESDEELKKRKALNVLTPNKSLTKLPILFVKIKAANNSCKLKNEIIQIL